MAKQGFKRNHAAIGRILKRVDGGKRAAADRVIAQLPADVRAEAVVEVYATDREVVGVKVPFESQALDGSATRAAGAAGLRQGRP